MSLRYLQTEIFYGMLTLELVSDVIQSKLLPLVGIPPEEWISYLVLFEQIP